MLILPLIAEIIYSSSKAYFFRETPIWNFEITLFLYGTLFMLGGAYCQMEKKHVAVEALLPYLSPKWVRRMNIFSELVVFFVVAVMLYVSIPVAYRSFIMAERSTHQTPFDPRIWPYRCVIPIACVLLVYQTLKTLRALFKNDKSQEPSEEALG